MVKIDFRGQTIITGNDVHEVLITPSSSEEGRVHIAVRYALLGDEVEAGTNKFEYEEHYNCSCPGFQYNRQCKHVKDLGYVKEDRTA